MFIVCQVLLEMVPGSSNGLYLALLKIEIRAPPPFSMQVDSSTTLDRFSQVSLAPSAGKVLLSANMLP
jgi:hypothetical protein